MRSCTTTNLWTAPESRIADSMACGPVRERDRQKQNLETWGPCPPRGPRITGSQGEVGIVLASDSCAAVLAICLKVDTEDFMI